MIIIFDMKEELKEAVRDIDSVMGKGYAKSKPELLAAVLKIRGEQTTQAVLAESISSLGSTIERGIMHLCKEFPVTDNNPIERGLEQIADAISGKDLA